MIARFRNWVRAHPRATGMIVLATAAVLVLVAVVMVAAAVYAPRAVGEPGSTPTPTPLPSPSASVTPSATPSPSATSAPTATVEPSPTTAVSPEPTPVVAAATVDQPFAAVVLVDDLRVREEAGDGTPVASLEAGQVVAVHGEAQEVDGVDWYFVEADGDSHGWVSAGPPADPYLELHRPLARQLPAFVEDMVGTPAGYLAWGVDARRSDAVATRFVAVSADGVDWQRGALPMSPDEAAYLHVAHGPAGWVLVAMSSDPMAPAGVWRSGDGLAWEQIDASIPADVVPQHLVGTSSGYVLTVSDDRPAFSRAMVFTSSDGVAWRQLDPDLAFGLRLARLRDGFVAYGEGESNDVFVRVSADGRTWATAPDLSLAGLGGTPLLEVIEGDLLIVSTGFGGEAAERRIWRSGSDGAFAWERQTEMEALFGDQSLVMFESDGDSMIAAGQRFTDGAERWWRSDDGRRWEPIEPAGTRLADMRSVLVTGPNGFVGVTNELTPAGPNPRFVGTQTGVDWGIAATNVLGTVDSAVVGSCPEEPVTMLEWLAVPGAVGAECFGSSPITFAAWHTDAGGCGGFAPGRYEPSWLASPFASARLILTPTEATWGGCGSAVLAPDAPPLPATQQWVEVTGHWDDPAAAECRYVPDPAYPMPVEWGLAFRCRTSFVATSVVPITEP